MIRNVPRAFGRYRPRRGLPWVVALGIALVVSACSPAAIEPRFSLSIRNAGDAPIRLKVLVASEARPGRDLLVPARSGILQTVDRPMDVRDGEPDPVVIEVYTHNCALLTSITVGEGRTRITIEQDLSVTTAGGASDIAGAVEPDLVTAC